MRAVHGAVVQVQRVRAAEFGQQNGVQAWRDAVTQPDAVLCRTNVGAMAQVMTLMAAGYRVALARGGDSLQALALAARGLKEGRRTHHPELILFPCWGDLQDYAAHDPAGRDLQPLVNLVDTHGADAILTAVAHLAPELHAQVTVSTAHKAKGREGSRVLIADGFARPDNTADKQAGTTTPPDPIDGAEARLAYVAVTRIRQRLDLGGLSWIHGPPDGSPPSPNPSPEACGHASDWPVW